MLYMIGRGALCNNSRHSKTEGWLRSNPFACKRRMLGVPGGDPDFKVSKSMSHGCPHSCTWVVIESSSWRLLESDKGTQLHQAANQ